MTAFTTIPDDVLEPGDPIRSIDIIALRDNPIAMFEGAAGAPRLVGNGVSLFPGTYPVLTVTASDDHSANLSLGTIRSAGGSQSTSFVDAIEHTNPLLNGAVRFRASATTFGSVSWEARVLKNGNLVQSFSGTNPTSALTIDISVVPNDIILWQVRRTGGNGTIVGENGNNTASNGYVLRELFAPAV